MGDPVRDAEIELDEAGDWSKVPLIGSGMAAGEFARSKLDLGRAGRDIIAGVELPEYSPGDYGQYSLAGQYDPSMAESSLVDEDPRLRSDQMAALERLSGGMDASSQAKADAARWAALDEGNQLAQGREGAIRQQMERGGQSGNGMNALMQAQSAQLGANRAREGTMDAVHQQALERLANEQAMIGAAGQVRGQDFGIKQANADTLNKFNMFNTGATNEAKRMNLGAQQQIGNANVDTGNRSLDRRDRNSQSMFGNKMQKASGEANALQGMAAGVGASQASANQANQQTTDATKDTVAALAGLFGGGG